MEIRNWPGIYEAVCSQLTPPCDKPNFNRKECGDCAVWRGYEYGYQSIAQEIESRMRFNTMKQLKISRDKELEDFLLENPTSEEIKEFMNNRSKESVA